MSNIDRGLAAVAFLFSFAGFLIIISTMPIDGPSVFLGMFMSACFASFAAMIAPKTPQGDKN